MFISTNETETVLNCSEDCKQAKEGEGGKNFLNWFGKQRQCMWALAPWIWISSHTLYSAKAQVLPWTAAEWQWWEKESQADVICFSLPSHSLSVSEPQDCFMAGFYGQRVASDSGSQGIFGGVPWKARAIGTLGTSSLWYKEVRLESRWEPITL